jgi:hypothetical protein
MNTPAGTELPISHNVSASDSEVLLVTVTTEVEQTEVTPSPSPTMAPQEEPQMSESAATRVPASPSLWERATGGARAVELRFAWQLRQ